MSPSSPAVDNPSHPRTSGVHYSDRPPEPSAFRRSDLYGPRPTDNQGGGYGRSSPRPSRQPHSMPIGSDDDGYISSNTTTTANWGHSRPASRGAGPSRDADRQDGHGDQSGGGSIAVAPVVGSTTGMMTGIDGVVGLEGTGEMGGGRGRRGRGYPPALLDERRCAGEEGR